MIEESLIESARSIKKEFNSLNDTLETYESDVLELAAHFLKISTELSDISKNINKLGTLDTIEGIRDKVFQKLDELEAESNKICNKINHVNESIDKLKKEEMDLYNIIKKRYPSLSDDEIKIEVQRRI